MGRGSTATAAPPKFGLQAAVYAASISSGMGRKPSVMAGLRRAGPGGVRHAKPPEAPPCMRAQPFPTKNVMDSPLQVGKSLTFSAVATAEVGVYRMSMQLIVWGSPWANWAIKLL